MKLNELHSSLYNIVTDDHIVSLMHIMGQQGNITTTSVLGALRILDNNPGSGKHSCLLLYIPSTIQSEYILVSARRKNKKRLGYWFRRPSSHNHS